MLIGCWTIASKLWYIVANFCSSEIWQVYNELYYLGILWMDLQCTPQHRHKHSFHPKNLGTVRFCHKDLIYRQHHLEKSWNSHFDQKWTYKNKVRLLPFMERHDRIGNKNDHFGMTDGGGGNICKGQTDDVLMCIVLLAVMFVYVFVFIPACKTVYISGLPKSPSIPPNPLSPR